MSIEVTHCYYLCREVPADYVSTVRQDMLPTKTWEEWYDKGRAWPVLMIMKARFAHDEECFWIPDWIYRVRSNDKYFYLHMSNQEDYDLMDAFGVPHLNTREEVIYARGWEPEKATHVNTTAARRERVYADLVP